MIPTLIGIKSKKEISQRDTEKKIKIRNKAKKTMKKLSLMMKTSRKRAAKTKSV